MRCSRTGSRRDVGRGRDPAFFVFGVWACGLTGRDLGVADHGGMVWDEIVAFLPCSSSRRRRSRWQAVAFVLFRFFDIGKPPPIRADRARVKGGFGVMLDDVVAAFYTLLVLAAAKRLLA